MTETPAKNSPVPWVKPPQGAFEAYSNQTHINWSLDDVRLRFAQIGESGEYTGPGSPLISVNYEKAAITLSWRNAKILQAKLATLISNYEKVNGEIKLQVTLASNEGT
jgi:hypothetical protein